MLRPIKILSQTFLRYAPTHSEVIYIGQQHFYAHLLLSIKLEVGVSFFLVQAYCDKQSGRSAPSVFLGVFCLKLPYLIQSKLQLPFWFPL